MGMQFALTKKKCLNTAPQWVKLEMVPRWPHKPSTAVRVCHPPQGQADISNDPSGEQEMSVKHQPTPLLKVIYTLYTMKKSYTCKFGFGEEVRLKTDLSSMRIVTGIVLRPSGKMYEIARELETSWHQEVEIEKYPESKRAGFKRD